MLKSILLKWRLRSALMAIALVYFSCQKPVKEEIATPEILNVQGTWELLSSATIENGDTAFSEYGTKEKMIKIINDTHFSFLRHDLNNGKDSTSAVFVAGGGKYELEGNTYTEYLEFCNFRGFEDNVFHFELEIRGDTLIQQGEEKVESLSVDRIIIEKYKRVK